MAVESGGGGRKEGRRGPGAAEKPNTLILAGSLQQRVGRALGSCVSG